MFRPGVAEHSCVGISSTRTRSGSRSKLDAATVLSLDEDTLARSSWDEPSGGMVADIKDPKVGVLLLNLGGPETGEDVEGEYI